jgi:hypothetical protein
LSAVIHDCGTGPVHPRDQRRWLRVRAAADYLGVGVGTLNKLRTYGGGPRYSKLTPGGVVIYDVADLDEYAEERKVCSTSERVRTG